MRQLDNSVPRPVPSAGTVRIVTPVVIAPLSIAQVTPYTWEEDREVNRYVDSLARALARRGHRVVIVAPSLSRKLVKESRALIRSASGDRDRLFNDAGGIPRVLGVGQSLPFPPARLGGTISLPIDIARTLEDLFAIDAFDFVHVHEPFAPSASNAALRLSRALNVGTFHHASERTLSTQVARRFVELFFGRLDARVALTRATRDQVQAFFGGDYEIIGPGADPVPANPDPDGLAHGAGSESTAAAPLHVYLGGAEERAAQRILLRALRKLPRELDWRATIRTPAEQPIVPAGLSRRMRERIAFVGRAEGFDGAPPADADIAVAASAGTAPSPGMVAEAIASGAVPLAANLPQYSETLGDGELGLMFDPGDAEALAAQLRRLIEDEPLRQRLRNAATAHAHRNTWAAVAERHEGIYERVMARRHDLIPGKQGDPKVRAKLASRKRIDVDLHMHTDHSHDCATPVEVLLETARVQGLGAIAVTDHNEVSGALAAARIADDFGVKVIVGEEIKTAEQGEVIGLFIKEKIPKGVSLQEAIREIKRQGGLVYVPHPFDRMHSVPDYRNLIDVIEDIDLIEIFNPRVAIGAFNEEAARFAAKYRIVAGAGSDSHVSQGLGSVRISMHDFDGPQEFLESLRTADIARTPSSLVYVQALKFLQTKTGLESRVPKARRRRSAAAARKV